MLCLVSHHYQSGTHRRSPGDREGPVQRQLAVGLPDRQFYHRDHFSTTITNISILRVERELGTAGGAGTIPHGQHEGIAAAVKVPPCKAFPTSRLERVKYLNWVPSDVEDTDDDIQR